MKAISHREDGDGPPGGRRQRAGVDRGAEPSLLWNTNIKH